MAVHDIAGATASPASLAALVFPAYAAEAFAVRVFAAVGMAFA